MGYFGSSHKDGEGPLEVLDAILGFDDRGPTQTLTRASYLMTSEVEV